MGSRRPEIGALWGRSQFAAEVRDVILVQLDLLLVRLEAVEHTLIIALAAKAHGFLRLEFFSSLLEQFFLIREFPLENFAAVRIALTLGICIDLGKIGWRPGRGSRFLMIFTTETTS